MAIAIGQQLGSYEITALIGKGGMGEVYRARDTKLKREVAIKILPDEFSRDPERVRRFQREAEALAAINHQIIGAIYDLQQADDTHFLVLELVEGETLAERIARGPIPIEDAVEIAKQICEALEAAHEKDVIHRDLKPANVKITPAGKVKVLDFGLAKAIENAPSNRSLSNSPTALSGTMGGMIVGTAAYMSPEQARGGAVDRRTDIFSLGAVLYEMLTGRQAFQGDNVSDIMASVLKTEPEWNLLPKDTPPAIRRLLGRCLQKDKTMRLRDAGDARLEIQEARSRSEAEAVPQVLGLRRPIPSWMSAMIGVAVLTLGVAIGAWLRSPSVQKNRPGVARLTFPLTPKTELLGGGTQSVALAISPDGTQVAYPAIHDGLQQLYLRRIDSLETKPVAGTDGATFPFFSPDGQWLGFLAAGKLKKISTRGGIPVTLTDGVANGASWGPNDTIVFPKERGFGEISSAGGDTRRLRVPDLGDVLSQYPEFLPGGQAILFTAQTAETATADEKSIEVLSLKTGLAKVLIQGGSYGRYVPTGHIIFLRSGTLLAAPFDLKQLEVTGPWLPVIDGVRESVLGVGAFSCSPIGNCVYAGGGMSGAQRTAVMVDRSGASQPVMLPPGSYNHPRFSPEGGRVVFWRERVNCDVVVFDIARGALTRLTLDGDNHFPIWTPDGKRVTYVSRKSAGPTYELFWKPADGSGNEEKLSPRPLNLSGINPLSWTPDEKNLAFGHGGNIWLLPLSGERTGQPFFQSKFNETMPAFSPDGHWLAYVSDESGRPEVYVQPFPGPGGKYNISTDGGTEPVWARNGKELFYRRADQLMAVEINTDSTFSAGKPKRLFEGPYVRNVGRVSYDVSPDGQRFLMLKAGEEEQASSQINVLLNWLEELKQRVPVK
jgi:Tol biopolymer transport system component/tRNA A-37 threonylcarbamoyl transferase component Bud32